MKPKKDLETLVREELPEFLNEVQTLSTDDLNGRLAVLAKEAESVRDAKSEDEGLREAKEQAKNLGAPYRDALKTISVKSRFIILLLKSRGAE